MIWVQLYSISGALGKMFQKIFAHFSHELKSVLANVEGPSFDKTTWKEQDFTCIVGSLEDPGLETFKKHVTNIDFIHSTLKY